MSDELPEGSVNLEDDGPEIPSAPDPVAAAAPPEPPAPVAEPEPEESVEINGQRMVPVGALVAERKQRQTLSEKAAQVDQLQEQVRRMAPYVEFLRANPGLMQPPQQRPEPPPSAPQADPDAVEAAQLMDFYKADGSLDVEKGAKWLSLQDRRAAHVSREAVRPYQELTAQQKSQSNFQAALTVKDAQGVAPTRESLEAVWRMMPTADTSDPQVAGVMAALALGLDRMKPQPQRVAPSAPPLVTEGSGGNVKARPVLSALEERVAKERGISAQTWSELTKDHTRGRSVVLED